MVARSQKRASTTVQMRAPARTNRVTTAVSPGEFARSSMALATAGVDVRLSAWDAMELIRERPRVHRALAMAADIAHDGF